MADPKKIKEEAEATRELTEAEKERKKVVEDFIKLQEERNNLNATTLAYQVQSAQRAGNINKTLELQLKLEEALVNSTKSLSTQREKLEQIENKLLEATGEQRKELLKNRKIIKAKIATDEAENKIILEILHNADKLTRARRQM